MPRTFTGAQRTASSGVQLACFGKLEITDPDGAWRDVASLNATDWFNTATIADSIDSNTLSFSAVVLRDAGNLSLSPFRSDSLVNRNGAGAFAPMLDNWRQWRVSTAVLGFGGTPIAGDWKEVGKGYVDVIDIQDTAATITITGRGMEAPLLDGFIPRVRTYGSNAAPIAMETVLQSMLDDQLGTGAVPLYTPVSPLFVMRNWAQATGNFMSALAAVADKAGYVLRYRYDAADALRFTLSKPNRTPGAADWVIGASEYLALPSVKTDITGVRNYIEVTYLDATLGKQVVTSPALSAATVTAAAGAATFSTSQAGVIANGSVIVVGGVGYTVSAFNGTTGCTLSGAPTFAATPFATSASLTRYGLRYMAVDLAGDSQVTSTAQAQGMADAMRSDLELPAIEQAFETFGFWFVQLGDYGQFTANGVHYDQDQFGGVTTYSHTLANGTLRTKVGVRGKPAGRNASYRQLGAYKQAAPPVPVAPIPSISLVAADVGDSSATVHLDVAIGTTPPSSLTYSVTQKIGRAAPTVIDSGIATALPKDLAAFRSPRLDSILALSVVDAVTGTSRDQVTISADGRDGARGAGTATGRTNEDGGRSGTGGMPTPLGRYATQPIYDPTGATALIDPVARQFHASVQYPNGIDDASDGTTYKKTTLNEKTGAGRGFVTIDSGNSIVAAGIDFVRSFVNKHMGNVPDDVTSDRRAATLNQKTGGDRAVTAIDAGGVAVTTAVDLSRGYTGKHMGNIPDDATSDRRAATLNQKTGGDRGAVALDSTSKLVTGVTAAATAADGVAGIESSKGSGTKAARNAGTATARVGEDKRRAGVGGIPTPLGEYLSLPMFTPDGSRAILDPAQIGALTAYRTLGSVKDNCQVSLQTGPQSIANGTATKVLFTTVQFDVGVGLADMVNNGEIVIPTDYQGLWVIHFALRWVANGTGYRKARIQDSTGGTLYASESIIATAGAATDTQQHVWLFVNSPAAGSRFQCIAQQNSGGALNAVNGVGATAVECFRVW